MKKKIKAGVLILFVLLTFLHLIPLSIHPSNSVSETIDSLLNTWTLSHIHNQLFFNPLNIFHANIFYPHPNTLSYSEHLFPQALLSLPISYFFKNPILAYNFVFFLAYILNGYVMFVFVRYLTKNNVAGIACGIMFAFNTFSFNHISHLQILNAWPIPLSFLYLHKYFENKNLKNSVLFSLFFILQALSCIYYGLFFLSILVIVFPVLFLIHHKKINFSFLLKLGVPLILSGVVLFIVSLPYLSIFKKYGFQRGLTKGADLVNYLAVNPHNVFLAKFLNSLGRHEYFLFPGIMAFLFAAFFLFQKRKLFRINPKILKISAIMIIFISVLMIVFVKLTGGFSLKLGLISISSHNLAKQALYIFIVGLLLLLICFFKFILKQEEDISNENKNLFLYTLLFSWALLLSFGSSFNFLGNSTSVFSLPFKWFYDHVPGFKGIRVPSRYAIFVIFSTAVLAGYGIKYIFDKIKKRKIMIWATLALLLFLNLEYISIPHRIRFIPIKNDIPPTYRWLRERAEEATLLELPFQNPIGRDTIYMYFSIFHKKKIVNGYSGFFPPAIYYIRKMFRAFPSWVSIDILKALKVKYVVLHKKMWKEEQAEKIGQNIQNNFKSELRLKKEFKYSFESSNYFADKFGEDVIYEVDYKNGGEEPRRPIYYQEVSCENCEIKSARSEHLLHFLIDNNLDTKWTTGRQKTTGDFLLVKFKKPVRVAKVSLFQGKFNFDYALRIRVKASLDGKEWRTFHRLYSPGEFARNLIHNPLDLVQNIHMNGKKIKFLKIIQIGNDKTFWWSVAELKIYKKQE